MAGRFYPRGGRSASVGDATTTLQALTRAPSSCAAKPSEHDLRGVDLPAVRRGDAALELDELGFLEVECLVAPTADYDDLGSFWERGVGLDVAPADTTSYGVHCGEE
jgi:hypothetical protein